MNVEQNRLISFNIWPTNAPIDPERLAKAGFYATGKGLETECHWCRKRISDWQYGDQIMMRHRRLFPLCPFVLDPGATENIPLIGPPLPSVINRTTDFNSHEPIDMKKESNRLLTFKYWPNPNISPQALSKAGFYYINLSDQVKCAWCKGVIAKWEKDDNAFDEHKRFFPDCPLVQLGPYIELANDDIRELGIQQFTPPKRAKYSSLDARLRTYTNWPISDIQKPETLANAGFYYQGTDDHVRCFHCNGGLRSWQKDDDPWVDHVKWFSHCQFVKLVKGPNYVTEVQRLLLNEYSDAEPEPETPMSLEDAMCTQPVLQALEMGLNVAVVRNATLRHLQSTGRPYQTNEELVTAVLDDQNDIDEEDEEEVMPEYQQSSSRNLSRIINCFVNAGSRSEAAEAQPASSTDTVAHNIPLPASSSAGANGVDRRCECPPSQSDSDSHDDEPHTSRSPVPGPSNIDDEKPTCSDAKLERNMSLEEENRKLKDARLCKVCMDEEVGVVFLPCGHLVTCVQCASGINQCPLCRTDMKGFVRTFLS